jgi:hypothetical protein
MKRELPPSTGHEHHQHAMDTLCVAIYTGIHCCLAYIVSIPRDGGGEGGGYATRAYVEQRCAGIVRGHYMADD